METLLYTAELIQEGDTYTLVVQDLVRDTVQTTPVPKTAVDRLPVFLSALTAKLNSVPSRGRW
ncbi:hypothetical protein F7Q99_33635 [Streptomyces kaniharaensis]|uniref:Uncharacterized protein n=1 Tax=Streptomyces kaniharaensis TaxID=212423 RepID=A0A6N7L050_9ACTN|nr:hypothetical protein [Streptomyces kaniharaensis]MQS17001.1 hypothetical protein [Streptomyces kaniharaensis]